MLLKKSPFPLIHFEEPPDLEERKQEKQEEQEEEQSKQLEKKEKEEEENRKKVKNCYNFISDKFNDAEKSSIVVALRKGGKEQQIR